MLGVYPMLQIVQWSAIHPRVKMALAGIAVCIVGTGAWFLYYSYTMYQGRKAQIILGECLDEYQKALESKQDMWSEIVLMNELGLNQASGSSLQPYFMVMQAQALAHQKKFDEAVAMIEQADAALNADLPYKAYYALTKSLMQLDASNMKEQGFANLQQLAHDDSYTFQDAALYYLGSYYWVDNNLDKAKETWQLLIDGAETSFKDSPWVAMAEQKYVTL